MIKQMLVTRVISSCPECSETFISATVPGQVSMDLKYPEGLKATCPHCQRCFIENPPYAYSSELKDVVVRVKKHGVIGLIAKTSYWLGYSFAYFVVKALQYWPAILGIGIGYLIWLATGQVSISL